MCDIAGFFNEVTFATSVSCCRISLTGLSHCRFWNAQIWLVEYNIGE